MNYMYNFEGKRALVTGGSRGIGKAVTEALLKYGADVRVLSKSKQELIKLLSEFPDVHTIQADLADWDAARKAIDSIGAVDFLVNNWGISVPSCPFLDYDKNTIDHIIDVNLKSAIHVSQVVARNMVSQNIHGSIVNMSSVLGLAPLHGFSIYCVSKAGLDMATKAMALELGPHKIRVNSVNPTLRMSDLGNAILSDPGKNSQVISKTPLVRKGEFEDVVNSVLFFLSDKTSMINGTCMNIETGKLCS